VKLALCAVISACVVITIIPALLGCHRPVGLHYIDVAHEAIMFVGSADAS